MEPTEALLRQFAGAALGPDADGELIAFVASSLRSALEARTHSGNVSWDPVIDDLLDFLPQAGDRALMAASLEELEASVSALACGHIPHQDVAPDRPAQPPAQKVPETPSPGPKLSRAARRRRNAHLAKDATAVTGVASPTRGAAPLATRSASFGTAVGPTGRAASFGTAVGPTGRAASFGTAVGPTGRAASFGTAVGPTGRAASFGAAAGPTGHAASFGFSNGVLVSAPADPRGDAQRTAGSAVPGAADAPPPTLPPQASACGGSVSGPSCSPSAVSLAPPAAASQRSEEEELPSREESLSFLASCYPQIDASAVNSVLDSTGDDPYEALRALESLVVGDCLPSSHDVQAPPQAPVLHRYMNRAEALEALLLKYPQFGDASVASVLDAAGGDPLQAVEILDELLGDDADAAAAGHAAPSAARQATADLMFRGMQSDEKVERLLEAFPHFGVQAVEQTLKVVGGDVYRAIAVLEEADSEPDLENRARDAELLDFPMLGEPGAAANRPSRRSFAATAANVAGRSDPGGVSGGSRSRSGPRARPIPGTPWRPGVSMERFTTGAEAAREYHDFRSEAISLARQRSAVFQRAARAYLSGDRALAKELSRKGREISAAMQLAHERAADQIFLHRNVHSGGTGVFDLHNLHVSEAVRLADSVVEQALRERRKSVCFVVGVGHHSKGRAKIGPTLLRHFVELGHDVDESYPGVLHVRI